MTERHDEADTAGGADADADAGGTAMHDAIARRAHELSESEDAGSAEENWLRAEREVRGIDEPGGL